MNSNLLLSVKLGPDEAPAADATPRTDDAAAEAAASQEAEAAPEPRHGVFWFGR